MNVYVCEHKDEKLNAPDYFVSKNYEAGIGWLREKAKGSSGDAGQMIVHFRVDGAGTTLAINSMKLIANASGVSCEIDPIVFKAGAIKILSSRERRVTGGKVQNWRTVETVKK